MKSTKGKHSKNLYFPLTRRNFIKGAVAGSVIAGAPAILKGLTRRVKAAEKGVIRMMFTAPTMIPGDWTRFEKDTGLKMEDTVIKDDPGIFLTEVQVNDAGDRFDLISTLSGVEQSLIDGGNIMQMEASAMPNWAGMPASIQNMPYLVRDLSPDAGKVWGVPMAMNADSFGYLPAKLGEPRPPEEASWSLVFESEKTMGRSSTGDNYIYLWEALAYLKNTGQLAVKDILNPSPDEAKATADFLIKRKEAGQFRLFWKIFDDQIAVMKNGEVDAIRCWEPAVNEVNKAGGDWVYATAKEFFCKWMHAAYITSEVEERGNLDEVYTALNWFLSGGYASTITPLRGYLNGRPDLAVDYANANGMDDISATMDAAQEKLKLKFAKEDFWFSAVPENLQEMQAQMDRVLNA
jgi:spermidine/putrescine-binding protein